MLENIKLQIGISDNSKDKLLNLYIRKAQTAIKNYLNITDEKVSEYQDAVIEFVCIMYNKKGNEGVNCETQGSRSTTYEKNIIPDSVKALLPLPKIKMKG